MTEEIPAAMAAAPDTAAAAPAPAPESAPSSGPSSPSSASPSPNQMEPKPGEPQKEEEDKTETAADINMATFKQTQEFVEKNAMSALPNTPTSPQMAAQNDMGDTSVPTGASQGGGAESAASLGEVAEVGSKAAMVI